MLVEELVERVESLLPPFCGLEVRPNGSSTRMVVDGVEQDGWASVVIASPPVGGMELRSGISVGPGEDATVPLRVQAALSSILMAYHKELCKAQTA